MARKGNNRSGTENGTLSLAEERLSHILFERDTRTFPEVLSAWIAQEKGHHQTFVDKTGLATIVTAENIRDMELGTKVPSERLACLISMHLPGGILSPQETPLTNSVVYGLQNQLYSFQDRAAYYRKQNRKKPVIDLSDEAYNAFCLQTLGRFQQQPASDPNQLKVFPDADLHHVVMEQLKAIAYDRQHDMNNEEIESALTMRFRQDPDETVVGLKGLLHRKGQDYPEDKLRAYLTTLSTPRHVLPATKSLRFLRQSRSMTQEALALRLGVDTALISYWESGTPINPHQVGSLAKALHLTGEEAERFIHLVKPDIIDKAGEGWLYDKIATKNWKHIDYPALDPAWLDKQPFARRAGLFLEAYRERAHLLQSDLAEKLDMQRTAITRWESGENPVDPHKLGTLMRVLVLPTKDAEYFASLVNPHLTDKVGSGWLRNKITAPDRELKWEQINYPALDMEWIAAQDPKKRAGLLLEAYRNRNNLARRDPGNVTQDDLVKVLNVTQQTISAWEKGEQSIDPYKVGTLVGALRLTDTEAAHFILFVNKDIAKEPDDPWLQAKIEAKNWKHINYPALDPAWLDARDADKRAGILLKTFRNRSDLSRPQLADALKMDESFIYNWESGRIKIPLSKAEQLVEALGLKPEEKSYFLKTVEISAQAKKDPSKVTELAKPETFVERLNSESADTPRGRKK